MNHSRRFPFSQTQLLKGIQLLRETEHNETAAEELLNLYTQIQTKFFHILLPSLTKYEVLMLQKKARKYAACVFSEWLAAGSTNESFLLWAFIKTVTTLGAILPADPSDTRSRKYGQMLVEALSDGYCGQIDCRITVQQIGGFLQQRDPLLLRVLIYRVIFQATWDQIAKAENLTINKARLLYKKAVEQVRKFVKGTSPFVEQVVS